MHDQADRRDCVPHSRAKNGYEQASKAIHDRHAQDGPQPVIWFGVAHRMTPAANVDGRPWEVRDTVAMIEDGEAAHAA